MPAYIVDITKQHQTTLESWGNRYLVNAADLTDAASAVPIIVGQEKNIHFSNINFLQARVATFVANDGVYVTIPLDEVGQVPLTGKQMPLFLVVETVIQAAGFGRPMRKYYHTGFDDVHYDADFTYDDDFLDDVLTCQTQIIDLLSDNGTPWIKDLDHEATFATVRKLVLSHQFTKASKRNTP